MVISRMSSASVSCSARRRAAAPPRARRHDRRIGALTPRPDISLTTNGIGLARRAVGLAAAGPNRPNGSLDTLRP
jgi:molybdenum cofactor biosynthesis enzyme MoaA